ncbi:hypothetical protein [Saccharothrix xinjiangensis]|uniref:Uncharacterized protein n=1 Tax=Saccharothrix xinjiangensis TaxID=204798 RepID=A0ABV9YDH4_9PSEU
MSGREWQEAFGVAGAFILLTVVIAVTIWQLAASRRARFALHREQAYRSLAESAAVAQENADRRLTEIDKRLDEVRTRLGGIERVLKDVE